MTITLHWSWPQITLVLWMAVSLTVNAAMHGRVNKSGFHAGRSLVLTILLLWLLIAGGFFNPACAQSPPAAAQAYKRELMRAAYTQWGLDAPVAALAAQVHQESGWRADAVSHVGAQGLAQFMPTTAVWWCEQMGVTKPDCQPRNPTWALRAMVGFDKHLFDRTPPRMSDFDRLWVALRAYNGGLGHWQREAAATGAAQPTRAQVDAACGKARRAAVHCAENLGYPHRILQVLQPRYATWGRTV